MEHVTLRLTGRIPSKKNSMVHIVRNGSMLKFPSKDYQIREKDALGQCLLALLPKCKANKVTIWYTFIRPDDRAADITNKQESINDMLVKYWFLEDDRWQYLDIEYAKSQGIDRENPGVILSISYERNENIVTAPQKKRRKLTCEWSPQQQELFKDIWLA